ncbi:MAG: S-layer homology domain-containing protein [Clostridia bacterium]|nr:S-layer homology domain-containing protein [Clostridia bacterium]
MKKIIAMLLTLVMLIPTAAVMSSAYTNELIFTDVKKNDWFYSSVYNCWIRSYICGMTNEKGEYIFKPNDTLTRAQFLQMLANSTMDLIYNTSYATTDTGFEDVKTSHWYNAAVAWGVEKGIVKGVSETRFAPNDPVTREQMARMLYLFVEYKGYNMNYTDDLSDFTDAGTISDWALPQMQWAVAADVIKGYGNGELRPRTNTTRAEACTMLNSIYRYFSYNGPIDRSGAFAAICDYVIANGKPVSDIDSTELYITNEGSVLRIVCSNDSSSIYIACERQNEDMSERLYFQASTLNSYYDYTYQQSIPKGENEFDFPYVVTANITADGLSDINYIYGNYTDTEKQEQWQSLHDEFMAVFTELLESLGYTYEDLYR